MFLTENSKGSHIHVYFITQLISATISNGLLVSIASEFSFQIHHWIENLGKMLPFYSSVSSLHRVHCECFNNVSLLWLTQRCLHTTTLSWSTYPVPLWLKRCWAEEHNTNKVVNAQILIFEPNSQIPMLWTGTCIFSSFLNGNAIKKFSVKPRILCN